MGLKKLEAKVTDYKERLESGGASEIKPGNVKKVLGKLRLKATELEAKLADTPDDDERARLARKLDIAREQVANAEWLLAQLE